MELAIDLHLHSRFSRAVSPRMNLANMYMWGRKKGLNILSVADFTHPVWFREAREALTEKQEGIYALKNEESLKLQLGELAGKEYVGPYFMLSTEVACIYSEKGKVHRIHNLILSPNFETAVKINRELIARGANLSSDGRPILGLSSRELAELVFSIDKKNTIIPCHIWTPWFSLYGSKSGYDRIVDCFGEYAKYIFAVETGLSSDPSMNWRINELESRSIVSFSDAHSLEKMGREATVLHLKQNGMTNTKWQMPNNPIKLKDITYSNILNGLVKGKERVFELAYTIEFYPEEGKYHYTGHRNCGIIQTPEDTKKIGDICPVCRRQLTVGVMHRVDELSNLPEANFSQAKDAQGTIWLKDKKNVRPPFVNLVPLLEIIAESMATGVSSQGVLSLFDVLVRTFGSEHEVLLRTSIERIEHVAGIKLAEGIKRVRERAIHIMPGYDNTYGVVKIWGKEESSVVESESKAKPQLGLEF